MVYTRAFATLGTLFVYSKRVARTISRPNWQRFLEKSNSRFLGILKIESSTPVLFAVQPRLSFLQTKVTSDQFFAGSVRTLRVLPRSAVLAKRS